MSTSMEKPAQPDSDAAFIDDLPWTKGADGDYSDPEYFEAAGPVSHISVQGHDGRPDYTYSLVGSLKTVIRTSVAEGGLPTHDVWVAGGHEDDTPYGDVTLTIRNLAATATARSEQLQLGDDIEQQAGRRRTTLHAVLGGVGTAAGLLGIGIERERHDLSQNGIVSVALAEVAVLSAVIGRAAWKKRRSSL